MLPRPGGGDKRPLQRRRGRRLTESRRPVKLGAAMTSVPVTCPACFQVFEVPAPFPDETPCDVDYDCEICCRPMRILFTEEDGEVTGTASGLGD